MDIKEITNQIKELEQYKDKYERIKEMLDEINPKINEAVEILSEITGKSIKVSTGKRGAYKTGAIDKAVDKAYVTMVDTGEELMGKAVKKIGESFGLTMQGGTESKVKQRLLEKPLVKRRKQGWNVYYWISKGDLKNAKEIIEKKKQENDKGEGYVEVGEDGTKLPKKFSSMS